ncbi:hypothetical protein W97_06323 [Coniosporium apollinis CBS 100218]|uniref:Uncharacterized protein n=1 Tax=Coniosporium apollinis (strain CBS 100218) TaxID=1168221 RepID=R7YY93_CONA1|nr:uncharacterized protein W97_06323 [Coniosporium apollinis CBS 100218]EON66920.1 hypothetical protein W97_06323 [Coniosporium apollinis CBS 100218]
MAGFQTEDLHQMLESHPSLAASIEDYEPSNRDRAPFFGIPSTHSGFRSEESEPESESAGPWSPPAWRKAGSGWYRHQLAPSSMSGSRQTSPQAYESCGEGDFTVPANIPLPMSPLKQTPRTSPERDVKQEPEAKYLPKIEEHISPELGTAPNSHDHGNNYFRLAVNAEVMHRTEPIEAFICYLRDISNALTKSRASTITAIIVGLLSISFVRMLLRPPTPGPVPDLVKVAGLAKSFEPLIHYSENGVQQISDLQETGVAVWDLGESVRSTNMTSAPIIVKELDELSESLKTLAIELTRFFANVDGDVDSILIVMEWAKRELLQVSSLPVSTFTSAFDNLHTILCRIGLLESSSGMPTTVGKIVRELFGQTTPQRTKATLQRTFNEFLAVLEESINQELTYSTALFRLFEGIDRQFLNLQRSVVRETDQQEREEGEMLSRLWTRVIGANASQLRKYEKNRSLLASVRAKTVHNKSILTDHNTRLLQLKSNLEILRKKLVSPLVRSNDSSTLSVEDQIRGLDGTYDYLKTVRETQKGRMMELMYGAGSRRLGITRGEEGYAIDGR